MYAKGKYKTISDLDIHTEFNKNNIKSIDKVDMFYSLHQNEIQGFFFFIIIR